jgi:hypothetical protein
MNVMLTLVNTLNLNVGTDVGIHPIGSRLNIHNVMHVQRQKQCRSLM